MEFKKFCEELHRMCNYYMNDGDRDGEECPIHARTLYCADCTDFCMGNPEVYEKIVSDWSENHPRKTLLMVFSEKFSHYKEKDESGIPIICPWALDVRWSDVIGTGCVFDSNGKYDCVACWNRPAPEIGEE